MGALRRGTCLVARHSISEGIFRESVILLIDYSASRGATGLVVNKPTPLKIRDLMGHLEPLESREDAVFVAGPVQPEVAWVLHARPDVDASGTEVLPGLWLGGDVQLLNKIASTSPMNPSPHSFRFLRGYAGWAKRQLEHEIAEGSWVPVDLEVATVLGTPVADLWDDAMARAELPFPLKPDAISSFRLN